MQNECKALSDVLYRACIVCYRHALPSLRKRLLPQTNFPALFSKADFPTTFVSLWQNVLRAFHSFGKQIMFVGGKNNGTGVQI